MDLADSNLFYRHPELYDQVQADPDHTAAKLCEELVDTCGLPHARTLLDFGCGTGRDLERLTQRFESTGVEIQPQMISYARRQRAELEIRQGDVRRFRLGRTVDVITGLGNLLSYVHENAHLTLAFETFAAHAHAGTVLILHATIAPIELPQATSRRVDTADLHAEVTISYEWDLRTQINTMRRHWRLDDGREERDEIRRRVLGPRELEQYLGAAGFDLLDLVDLGEARNGRLTGPSAYIAARYVL